MAAAIEWSQGLSDAWSKVASGAPKVVYFLAVLIIGLFIVRIITRVIRRLAKRLNVDALVDKAGLGRYLHKAGLTGSELLARAVKFFLSFVVLTTAFAVFGPNNPVSRLIDRFVTLLPRILVAAVIIVITGLVARTVQGLLHRLGGSASAIEGVKVPPVALKAAPIAIWVIGTFAAVDELGVAPTTVRSLFQGALAAVVGISIVAVGGGGIAPMRQRWERWLKAWDTARTEPSAPLAPPRPPGS